MNNTSVKGLDGTKMNEKLTQKKKVCQFWEEREFKSENDDDMETVKKEIRIITKKNENNGGHKDEGVDKGKMRRKMCISRKRRQGSERKLGQMMERINGKGSYHVQKRKRKNGRQRGRWTVKERK